MYSVDCIVSIWRYVVKVMYCCHKAIEMTLMSAKYVITKLERRADVVGIFPNEASIMRPIGAVLFEQNDELQTSSRYMMVKAFAQIDTEEMTPFSA
jgi:transposase-like protein